MTALPATNGAVTPPDPNKQAMQDVLTTTLTQGYQSTIPLWALGSGDWLPQLYMLRDIELMLIHPIVRNALKYYKGGLTGAEFEIECDNPEAQVFIQKQAQLYWDVAVPKLQNGYEYGWLGAEPIYTDKDGPLAFKELNDFSPRDTYLLTQDHNPVGVRVKNIRDVSSRPHAGGSVDLWMATDDVPAKGLWYAHDPRYSNFYGQSQLLGAWRPWRRLAWKDGAETVTDTGVYRFAYAGPVIRYPDEDYQSQIGIPGTTLDSQGRPRRFARDMARQMAEQFKAGAGIGMPSGTYPPEMGGGNKWELDLPTSTLNVEGLIVYVKHLWDQIREGVGVPPELLAATETGSGYSGRAIPMEAFIRDQQKFADAFMAIFVEQILKPLVKWNFGPVKFHVKVKSLLKTKAAQQAGPQGAESDQAPPGVSPQSGQPLDPGAGGMAPAPAAGAPMSINSAFVTDRVRDIARRILARAA